MGRARKTHVQQLLRWSNAAGDLRGRKRESARGDARRGKRRLGRPRKPGAKLPHAKRLAFVGKRAVHVTLRIERALGGLRDLACYDAIRAAAHTVLTHRDCRIVHASVQRTHLHLIVEADSSAALSTGMQAFTISAAKHLNAAVSRAGSWWERRRIAARALAGHGAAPRKRRKGRVFADRYHARMIDSPLQARRELAYVLNNWRKHGEDRRGVARTWLVDPFSTGWQFTGWREHPDAPWPIRDTYRPIPTCEPRTWLLREGWRRYGLIGTHEVPSSRVHA